MPEFVSRAGQKLDHALMAFPIDVIGKICADLGCSTGGFVDCLLRRGAKKGYAIDTRYGVLDWEIRDDPRVLVRERNNAMHVFLPPIIEIVTIHLAWAKHKPNPPAAARV